MWFFVCLGLNYFVVILFYICYNINGESMNYKKLIFNWCLITICGLLIITILTFSALCLFSPLSMARFCSNLGFEKLETNFYLKDYNKNGNINSLYKVVINSYNLKNYEYVETYFEVLEKNERYDEFIDYVNNQNLKVEATNLNKSALLNEDNYLKNRYVLALINNGKMEKAYDYAFKNFENYANYTLTNGGTYLFYDLIKTNNEVVNQKAVETDLYVKLNDYMDLCIANFNNGFENFIEEDSIYLLALNTRIKQVYNSIHTLSINLELEEDDSLYSRVKGINDISVELL